MDHVIYRDYIVNRRFFINWPHGTRFHRALSLPPGCQIRVVNSGLPSSTDFNGRVYRRVVSLLTFETQVIAVFDSG